MSTSRSFFRPLLTVTCLVLTALGLRNTYADNAEEKKLAEQVACGNAACSTNLLSEARNPISQVFAFQILDAKGGAAPNRGVVQVECSRQYTFLGGYECKVKP
ncbi:MAG TPA: hypothetical protein VI197_01875 [Polyangiaceae bacterium]